MKLVKIENRYYVVDDSELKIGDWFYFNLDGICDIVQVESQFHLDKIKHHEGNQKVTHATHCLRCGSYDFDSIGSFSNTSYVCNNCNHQWNNVKPLNLSDVEEAINGYSIEKMAEKHFHKSYINYKVRQQGFIDGFKACQELMKDKLFTANDMYSAYNAGGNDGALHESLMDYESHDSTDAEEFSKSASEEFKNSLLPKTEWEIEIVDDKIVLL
jgi:hypothetical protein